MNRIANKVTHCFRSYFILNVWVQQKFYSGNFYPAELSLLRFVKCVRENVSQRKSKLQCQSFDFGCKNAHIDCFMWSTAWLVRSGQCCFLIGQGNWVVFSTRQSIHMRLHCHSTTYPSWHVESFFIATNFIICLITNCLMSPINPWLNAM